MFSSLRILLFLLIVITSCKPKQLVAQNTTSNEKNRQENLISSKQEGLKNSADSTFVSIKNYSSDFIFDMKYATEDNFLKQRVYDCPECYLRYVTIQKLIAANNEFATLGYRIKLFDCYRPLDIQKKMWKIVSNPNYVADPSKGSIHNRGGAVDITLVDRNGNELNMGTGFDFFGEAAGHNYPNLPDEVKKNRKLLKDIMFKNGFSSFDSEWWHYNVIGGNTFPLANFKWHCD